MSNEEGEAIKSDEVKKERRKAGRPRGIHNSVFKDIGPVLNEDLFRLWLTGKSLDDIVRFYTNPRTKQQQFTIAALRRATLFYKWDERKNELLDQMMKTNNEQIVIDKQRQLTALSMILEMNLSKIENAYQSFLDNPKKFFERIKEEKSEESIFVLKDLQDFKDFFDYYKKITMPELTETGQVKSGLSFIQNVLVPNQTNVNANVEVAGGNGGGNLLSSPDVRNAFFDFIRKASDAKLKGESDPILLVEPEKEVNG
jgi:hypothetical protein